ncbi:MAG TPA: protein-L-isoaspartate O-methyltransferase [Alphaproteobacteria bacterium]|nr:protein-L-isoaspartate O-methyltransferase [Alphaproteobacteria bacterium]
MVVRLDLYTALADFRPMQSTARHNMIDGQLRPNHVNNPALLASMAHVAREDFIPAAYAKTAYADTLTPLGNGRAMYAPMTLARLLQTLDIQNTDKVLVVAGATGYTAALLAPLAAHVTVTEDDAALLKQAQTNLKAFHNVTVSNAAPAAGDTAHGPYNVIVLDAAATQVPQALLAQLAEGGKIGGVFQGQNGLLTASVITKHGGTQFREELFETKALLHPALTVAEAFVF